MTLIPWRKKRNGSLAALEDFPTALRRMRSEFDELFEDFGKNWPSLAAFPGNGWKWNLDVEEQDDKIILHAEAPGFEAEDFDVRISGDRLTLKAAHKKESKEKGRQVQERCECYEALTLPGGIDPSKVDATYRNGILTVTIPRTREGRGQKVTVKPK